MDRQPLPSFRPEGGFLGFGGEQLSAEEKMLSSELQAAFERKLTT